MKRVFTRILFCIVIVLLVFGALLFLRYGGVNRRVLSNGYVIETHRDKFYFFGFPGSGSDMQGFCKVISPDENVTPGYYYLEMVQFESEITEHTIQVHNGRITVISPMVKPISENVWRLIFGVN